MRSQFEELATTMGSLLRGDEVHLLSLEGEDSSFVRFNHGRVRQAGSVEQGYLTLQLIDGRRHASGAFTLTGDADLDRTRLTEETRRLREQVKVLPEDPYLAYSTENRGSDSSPRPSDGAGEAEIVTEIEHRCDGLDLVGVLASGDIYRGFASSLGQRNWHQRRSVHFDWSLYHRADKAVKQELAGSTWDGTAFQRKLDFGAQQLQALARPAHTIAAGSERVYLTPAAVNELLILLAWGGFGLKAHKTGQTSLLKLADGTAELSSRVTLRENTAGGLAPSFEAHGFQRPDDVTLVETGHLRDCLISPRSAREYDVETNGAAADESPQSIEMEAGSLAHDRVLDELERGVYVGNLHYLNYSDRPACRTTGMTRFATFWVERGEIVAPLNVMRFDESVYRILGDQLVALTAERELMQSPLTYYGRSIDTAHVPGALVDEFQFTL